MKKLTLLFLICLSGIMISCSTESPLDNLPFVVTGIEPVKNSDMANYFQNNETLLTAKHFVLAPIGKFQIGDTISSAYFY